jgi:hypothetical protein
MSKEEVVEGEVTAPPWVEVGAKVVLYSIGGGNQPRDVKVTTIKSVATKSFAVNAKNEPRFNLASCKTYVGGPWGHTRCVVAYDSDTGRRELEAARKRRLVYEASVAVGAWRRDGTRENRLAAIAALQAVED